MKNMYSNCVSFDKMRWMGQYVMTDTVYGQIKGSKLELELN